MKCIKYLLLIYIVPTRSRIYDMKILHSKYPHKYREREIQNGNCNNADQKSREILLDIGAVIVLNQ